MDIYAVTFLAKQNGELDTFTDALRCEKNGIFTDSVRADLLRRCRERFPEAYGWGEHRFETMQVSRRWIKEAALADMLETDQ